MAVALSGVGAGDEVIVTPYTWGASIGCVLNRGGIPVFADIDPDTLTMDPASIEKCLSSATKAIIPVHMHGQPADMDPIMEIANKHGLKVIEDCAQSHGARYKGRLTGTLGHFGAFSFQGSKILQSGEGGALIFNDDEAYQEAILRFTHPIRGGAELKDKGRRRLIDCIEMYSRIHPFAAAILIAQLPQLEQWVRNRQHNAKRLYGGMEAIMGVCGTRLRDDCEHGFYTIPIRYNANELGGLTREIFMKAAIAEGVPLRVYVGLPYHLRPLLRERLFAPKGFPWTSKFAIRDVQYAPGDCPVVESYCESNEMVLNVYALQEPADAFIDQILEGLAKVARHADELLEANLQ